MRSLPFAPVKNSLNVYKKNSNGKTSSENELRELRRQILIARQHYVVSRVSFLSGNIVSAYLLLQQSFEMYLKSILRAYNLSGYASKQHNLIVLLSKGRSIPELLEIANNRDYKDILEKLYLGYRLVRFAEDSGYDWSANAFPFIDDLALKFEKLLQKKVFPDKKICLYVHDLMLGFFLNGNGFFDYLMTTNNSLATMGLEFDALRIEYAKLMSEAKSRSQPTGNTKKT